jgi:hypothetical protein
MLGRDLRASCFLLYQEIAHLRTVSVSDNHIKSLANEFQNMMGCRPDTGQLFPVGTPLTGKFDDVSPQGDNDSLVILFHIAARSLKS